MPQPPYIRALNILFLFSFLILDLYLIIAARGRVNPGIGVSLALTIAWMIYWWKGNRIGKIQVLPDRDDNYERWYLRKGLPLLAAIVWFVVAFLLAAMIRFIPYLNEKINAHANNDNGSMIAVVGFLVVTSLITVFLVMKIAQFDEKRQGKHRKKIKNAKA